MMFVEPGTPTPLENLVIILFLAYRINYSTSQKFKVHICNTSLSNIILYWFIYAGYSPYSCAVDSDDLSFCFNYTSRKPPLAPEEFSILADILMRENNWIMPSNCEEALKLYINLLQSMEHYNISHHILHYEKNSVMLRVYI